jgi:hypothetical protein
MSGDPRGVDHVRLKPAWKENLFLLLLVAAIVAVSILFFLKSS